MKKRFENGNLSDFQKNLVVQQTRLVLLGLTVWYVFICGVYGNIGQKKVE